MTDLVVVLRLLVELVEVCLVLLRLLLRQLQLLVHLVEQRVCALLAQRVVDLRTQYSWYQLNDKFYKRHTVHII